METFLTTKGVQDPLDCAPPIQLHLRTFSSSVIFDPTFSQIVFTSEACEDVVEGFGVVELAEADGFHPGGGLFCDQISRLSVLPGKTLLGFMHLSS